MDADPQTSANTTPPDLELLREDGPCLIVNKPAGILTEGPPAATDTLVIRVKRWLKERSGKPGNVYLGVPHRLDRAVSGAIVFAKNSKAAARLAVQFRDRQVQKIYWAIVTGRPDPPSDSMIDWVEKVPDSPVARVVGQLTPTAREAILRYRTLQPVAGGWLVEVELTTGRFHQIRCQFAHRGWPILGDRLYGAPADEAFPGSPFPPGEPPIALHARSLTILHPVRYDPLCVTAPLPPYWPAVEPDGGVAG